jgi:hypothetical protein
MKEQIFFVGAALLETIATASSLQLNSFKYLPTPNQTQLCLSTFHHHHNSFENNFINSLSTPPSPTAHNHPIQYNTWWTPLSNAVCRPKTSGSLNLYKFRPGKRSNGLQMPCDSSTSIRNSKKFLLGTLFSIIIVHATRPLTDMDNGIKSQKDC